MDVYSTPTVESLLASVAAAGSVVQSLLGPHRALKRLVAGTAALPPPCRGRPLRPPSSAKRIGRASCTVIVPLVSDASRVYPLRRQVTVRRSNSRRTCWRCSNA